MDDVTTFFAEVAAAHPRCFWLDGGGAREWSGRRSMVGSPPLYLPRSVLADQ